jgi:hypothetical protein
MKLTQRQILVLEEVYLGLVYLRGVNRVPYAYSTFRKLPVTRQTQKLEAMGLVTTVPLPPKYQTLGSRRFVTTPQGDEELIKRGIIDVTG